MPWKWAVPRPKMGQNGSKTQFSKSDPGLYGMLKQFFLAHFQPEITGFAPWKRPKCLDNGLMWVRNGSKTCCSKSDPGPFGMLKQGFLTRFEPVVARFGPWRMPKCFEKGKFWEQKWVKHGSKTCFSKSDRGTFGVHKQVFRAHFEPVLTELSPFPHMYAPSCTLRTYLRAVWWRYLELGRGV